MNNYQKLLILSFILVFWGCGHKEMQITSLEMLKGGKTFAVPTGTVADQFVLKKFPDAKLEYYNSVFDCSMAVKDGKADAVIYDLPILKNIAAKNEGLIVLDELLFDDQYGFAVRMGDTALKRAMDDVLVQLKSDGTYDDMLKRWFPSKGRVGPMPEFKFNPENDVLKFGTAAVTEPMSFVDSNKQVTGFDVEYACYIAKKLGKKIEVVDMEFGALLPALISGKVDMIGAGLSITGERAKKVLFSQCYYPSGIAAAVKDYGQKSPEPAGLKIKTLDDLKNKRIGVLLGSIHDAYATKEFPGAAIFQYPNISDLLFGLNSDKVDVAFFDHTSLKDILSKNPKLAILSKNVFTVPIAAGFNKENDKLRTRFNTFLKEIRSDGTYLDMVDRWMNKGLTKMPGIKSAKTNGLLKVGVVSDIGMPFTIMKDGKLVGFDIELATRFAAYAGLEFVPVDLPFGSLLASISTNKIDLITSSLMITPERKKQIDFSEPYYESGVSVVAKTINIVNPIEMEGTQVKETGNKTGTGNQSFFQVVTTSFYNNIILENRYLHIVEGLKVTVLISILAAILGTLIGGLVCYMRMSKRKLLSGSAKAYISLLRGIPVLVLLMIIYYVAFASVNINPVIVAIIAFGLNFGAYVSEMFRTGIESIDKGQKEAAIAGGFSKVQTFLYIIFPQALRYILPVYKGEFISLLKMTSIVGYIAVVDLTKAGDIIRSRTFDAFFPLIMVAVLYLFLAWLMTWALGRIEISVDPRKKQIKKMKEETR
ncbi:MAG: ABC transporter permease subunit [Bacteroidales bacterium]|nr:ABC transporter permease subunit [Bacteroidales bacterium]MDD4604302.1 ABC transporter permease subunit [Bacteroidales bacterium]